MGRFVDNSIDSLVSIFESFVVVWLVAAVAAVVVVVDVGFDGGWCLRGGLFLFGPLCVPFVVGLFLDNPSSSSPTVIATVAAALEREPICKRNEKKSVPT